MPLKKSEVSKTDMAASGRSGNRNGTAGFNWSVVLRVGVTVSILAYLGVKLNWAELGKQMVQSNPVWLLSASLLVGITFILAGIRWWLLLKVQGIHVSLRIVTALTLIGQFFNSFLLGSTGGDIVKVLYILKYAPDKKAHATLSIIMDRVLGLFILLCMALMVLPWQLHFLVKHEATRLIAYGLFVLFGSVLVGGLSLALIPFHRLPSFLQHLWEKIPLHNIIESLVSGFRRYGRSMRLTGEAVGASIAIWLLTFTSGYCIALAIHLDATYVQILVILSIVICVISIPISIGGHGVREGIFVLMFSAFGLISMNGQKGAGKEKAVLFSLLFFMLYLVWSLLGGLLYLTFRQPSAEMGGKLHNEIPD